MKRMKTTGLAFIMAAAICGLTACGGNGKETDGNEVSESEAVQITEDETEPAAPETEIETESDEEIPEEAAAVTETESEEFIPVAGLSENYADLENRCFAYNGQIFTLGESTLQDMIDAGIPFDDGDLNNAGNNVNSNYETSRYNVEINNYAHMQFTFINTTENSLTEAECPLSLVRWYTIYVPNPDYEDSLNEEITGLIRDAGNYVCFSFPLTLTKEQLLENNNDATEIDEYNKVSYKIDSEVYMGNSGYTFKFNRDTDQLEDVTVSWLP